MGKLRPHSMPGFTSLGRLVCYQTYPKAIDSSLPLLSQVTPGRHAPIDGSLPLYHKLFSMAVTPGTSRFTGLGISLPISSIHGHVTPSLNGRIYKPRHASLLSHVPKANHVTPSLNGHVYHASPSQWLSIARSWGQSRLQKRRTNLPTIYLRAFPSYRKTIATQA